MPRLTAEQLAGRKLGLGATDVVEALGLSPYEGAGPMRLFMQKTADDVEDEADPVRKPELEWGHEIEPLILSWYERETRRRTLPGGHVPSREHDFLWSTLDATVIGESRIVEIKNVGANLAWHWDAYAEDGIPRYVRAQVTIGMHCHGARTADVVASVGGRAPHIWEVTYDEELAVLLTNGAREFWAMVMSRTAPPLDATPATKEYLRRKYPSNVDRVIVDADAEAEKWGQARLHASVAERSAATTKDIADAELLALVGPHDGIQGQGWKMTWKTGKDGVRRQRFTEQG